MLIEQSQQHVWRSARRRRLDSHGQEGGALKVECHDLQMQSKAQHTSKDEPAFTKDAFANTLNTRHPARTYSVVDMSSWRTDNIKAHRSGICRCKSDVERLGALSTSLGASSPLACPASTRSAGPSTNCHGNATAHDGADALHPPRPRSRAHLERIRRC